MGALKKAVIHWDGKRLPKELKKIPPGTYVLECLDIPPPLSRDQERGILKAMKQLDEGRGIPLEDALKHIHSRIKRR